MISIKLFVQKALAIQEPTISNVPDKNAYINKTPVTPCSPSLDLVTSDNHLTGIWRNLQRMSTVHETFG